MISRTLSGVWTTADGQIRLELRPDGRFDESHDGQPAVFTGRYVLDGEHLHLFEESGGVAFGRLVDGRLSIGAGAPTLAATTH